MFDSQKQTSSQASGARPPKSGSLYAPNRNIHLFDRFAVVIKYHKAVVAVFVLVVAGWMYQTYTTIPMYRAQARLQIEEEHTAQTDFKDAYFAYSDPEPYYQTQYRILQGRDLARRAVRRLKLETVPEFNGTGPSPTRLTRLLETFKAKALAPFTGGKTQEAAAPAAPGQIDENGLVGGFQGRVQVVPVRSSRLVDVAFTSADPEFAARAVNVLAEEYVQQNLEFKLENTQKTLDWLTREVAKQQTTVQESERLMAEYRENQNALSLEDR
jgi:succinoglycan biosynthesis transport protein ExoP